MHTRMHAKSGFLPTYQFNIPSIQSSRSLFPPLSHPSICHQQAIIRQHSIHPCHSRSYPLISQSSPSSHQSIHLPSPPLSHRIHLVAKVIHSSTSPAHPSAHTSRHPVARACVLPSLPAIVTSANRECREKTWTCTTNSIYPLSN